MISIGYEDFKKIIHETIDRVCDCCDVDNDEFAQGWIAAAAHIEVCVLDKMIANQEARLRELMLKENA